MLGNVAGALNGASGIPRGPERAGIPQGGRLDTQNVLVHPIRGHRRCSESVIIVRIDVYIGQYWNREKTEM